MPTPQPALTERFLAHLDGDLESTDAFLADAFPGDDGRRQPVHTVYVPADRFIPDLPQEWGQAALAAVDEHGGMEQVCAVAGVSDDLIVEVAPRVDAKLRQEPIEDLRLDFEDGYGDRGDEAEDSDSIAAAAQLAAAVRSGVAPSFAGLRFKCFETPTRRRGIRTLDLFLGGLLDTLGHLPAGLVITFPKVSTVSQVAAMVAVCDELERTYGLETGRLGFEIQVETPQLIIGPQGGISVAEAIHAGAGRVTALHYGTYDYSASLQISAEYQASITRPRTSPSRSCRSLQQGPECTCRTARPTSCRSARRNRCGPPGGCMLGWCGERSRAASIRDGTCTRTSCLRATSQPSSSTARACRAPRLGSRTTCPRPNRRSSTNPQPLAR